MASRHGPGAGATLVHPSRRPHHRLRRATDDSCNTSVPVDAPSPSRPRPYAPARSGPRRPLPRWANGSDTPAIEVGVRFRPRWRLRVPHPVLQGPRQRRCARRPPLDGQRHAAGDRPLHRGDCQRMAAGQPARPVPVTCGPDLHRVLPRPDWVDTPPTAATSRRRSTSPPTCAEQRRGGRKRRVPLRRAGVPLAVLRSLELLGRRALRPQRTG